VTILVHLREGYALLRDDAGQPCCKWRDSIYAAAILRGECTKRRWANMIVELAIASRYVERTPEGWRATDPSRWTHELPTGWRL
jgi:hypothetical protein